MYVCGWAMYMFICASLTGTQKHQVLRPKTVLSLQLVAAVCSCCLLQLQSWQAQGQAEWEKGQQGRHCGEVYCSRCRSSCTRVRAVKMNAWARRLPAVRCLKGVQLRRPMLATSPTASPSPSPVPSLALSLSPSRCPATATAAIATQRERRNDRHSHSQNWPPWACLCVYVSIGVAAIAVASNGIMQHATLRQHMQHVSSDQWGNPTVRQPQKESMQSMCQSW